MVVWVFFLLGMGDPKRGGGGAGYLLHILSVVGGGVVCVLHGGGDRYLLHTVRRWGWGCGWLLTSHHEERGLKMWSRVVGMDTYFTP